MALTVYNDNLALVRDVRQVRLPSGALTLRFEDVAASLNPAAVHVRSLTAPAQVDILEQNYEFDLLEPQKLLQKYVGREVTLVRRETENGAAREREVKATLLALNNGPIWRIDNEIVTGMSADHIRFPELPANLYAEPTLLWRLHNAGPAAQKLEVSYLTSGLSWNADYVLTLPSTARTASLDGWVTLTNTSGTSYRDAALQLVAGDINRVHPRSESADMLKAQEAFRAAAAPQFAQEAFADYHLYTLARRTSVGQRETKQISLLGAAGIPITKRYVVNGDRMFFRAQRPGAFTRDKVEVFYSIRNARADGLGQPLPAGTVRVFETDRRGQAQFVGEDRITHTPEDETIDLHVGNAFDVVAERKQTDFRRPSDDVWETAYEVRLRNHKTSGVRVEVNEPVGGDWQMIRSSHPFTKTAAFAAQFSADIPAGGETTITYRVRVR
ncbi:MAG: DUF4139 domain-containing protein [Vicinamibacterales bacterium]